MPVADQNQFIKNQQTLNQALLDFFNTLFAQAETLLGPPPIHYEVVVTGSMARRDMTPSSDIECMLFIDKPHSGATPEACKIYFKTLCQLVRFQLLSLGHKDYGLSLDETNPITFPNLIDTPANMVKTVKKALESFKDKKHTEEAEKRDFSAPISFLKPLSIRTSGKLIGEQSLLEQYEQALKEKAIILKEEALELLTIEQNSFKLNPKTFLEQRIDIKKDILGHFDHLLTHLSNIHELNTHNLIEILKALAPNSLAPEFSKICQYAIAELHFIRLQLHLNNDGYTNELNPPKESRLRLKCFNIAFGLLTPLYANHVRLLNPGNTFDPVLDPLRELRTSENSENNEVILESAVAYLMYCASIELSTEKLTQIFVQTYRAIPSNAPELRAALFKKIENATWPGSEDDKKQVISTLKLEPNFDGQYPYLNEEKATWLKNLKTLFVFNQPISDSDIQVKIRFFNDEDTPSINCTLHPEVLSQLIDENGHIKPRSNTNGRHHLLTIEYNGQSFCFKFLPEQPGIEYAINLLARLIGNTHGTLMTQLCHLHRPGKPGIAVQIMPEVKGESLDKILKNDPEKVKHISQASFTETLLRTLLVNPEDDKEDDYFLVPIPNTNPEQYRLVRIDNERAFYPVSEAGGFLRQDKLLVKTIVYCLNQMQDPLDQAALERFLSIDPLEVLKNWLKQLEKINENHRGMFNEFMDIKRHFDFKENEPDPTFNVTAAGPTLLGVPTLPKIAKELLTRLDAMQQVIKYKQRRGLPITGLDLLNEIQPGLAKPYREQFDKHRPSEPKPNEPHYILKRFNDATPGLYKRDKQQSRRTTITAGRAITKSFRKEK